MPGRLFTGPLTHSCFHPASCLCSAPWLSSPPDLNFCPLCEACPTMHLIYNPLIQPPPPPQCWDHRHLAARGISKTQALSGLPSPPSPASSRIRVCKLPFYHRFPSPLLLCCVWSSAFFTLLQGWIPLHESTQTARAKAANDDPLLIFPRLLLEN